MYKDMVPTYSPKFDFFLIPDIQCGLRLLDPTVIEALFKIFKNKWILISENLHVLA